MRRATSRPADRRGSIALEFLFLCPVFILLILAFAEFTAAVRCEEKLCLASHAGCKAACRGATQAQIEEAAALTLGPSLYPHSRIEVYRVVPGSGHGHGGHHFSPPGGGHGGHGGHGDEEQLVRVEHPEALPPGTPIVVIITVPATAVVPNFLRGIGFDLCGEHLIGQTAFLKE